MLNKKQKELEDRILSSYTNDTQSNFFKRVIFNLKQNKPAVIGLCVVIFLLIVGIAAPLIAPNDPYTVNPAERLMGMSAEYPLGTDHLGRCVFSRLLYATRTSLVTALVILFGNLLIGVPLGLIAGYAGGKIDNLIMRTADLVLTFPSSLVLLAIIGMLGTNIVYMIIVLTLLWWAPYARITRSMVIKLKEQDFVIAAEAAGKSRGYILIQHIGMCSISPVIVLATLKIASIIMHVASFSFIGIGTQAPNADWGVMLSDSRQFITTMPQLLLWPSLVIVLVVISLNLFGEGLKDALLPSKRSQPQADYRGD